MAQLQLTGVTGSLTVYGMISGSGTISGSNINASGNITALSFTGNGSGLTNVAASSVANALTAGTGLTMGGSTYNGSIARTIDISTVPIANGGTNANSLAANSIIYSLGTKLEAYSTPGLLYLDGSGPKSIGDAASIGRFVFMKPNIQETAAFPSASVMYQSSNLNIGIGVINDSYKLYIDGHLGVSGTVYETSTIKIKKNIESLTDEISKLIQVRPVEFDYIETGVHSYGFIAQELNEIYPDAVIKDENNEPIGVAYADLTSPIIRGIQQLYEKIEQLEERIRILELEKGA